MNAEKQRLNHLSIGAARSRIEFPKDFFPYWGIRGRLLTGIHDDIHVRCIVLDSGGGRAVLLSIEVGDLGDVDLWLDRVSRESGAPRENILLTVTHNHEAPHLSDSYNQPVGDPEKTAAFGKAVETAVVDAVRTAVGSMRPGRMAYGDGQCDINVNRDEPFGDRWFIGVNPHGISDKTVVVLKFEDLQGRPIAYFVNYAVHGCVMFDAKVKDGGMLVTGDLPGAVSRIVEARSGDAVVLWTSGAAADQNPRYLANRMVMDAQGNRIPVDAGPAGYLLLDVQAESLAEEVLAAAARAKAPGYAPAVRGAQRLVELPGKKKPDNPMGLPGDYEFQDGEPVSALLSTLMVGDVALLGVPGEIVCSIGGLIRKASPLRKTVVVTHCNGSLSYMSDEAGFERRTFEAAASHVKRGAAESILPDGFADMVTEMLDEV